MSPSIRELDYQRTPIGELILRCRQSPGVPDDLVYEVKLNDEMLMSSSVNESERALARLALEHRSGPCDVLVGGLGLGYTAAAALDYLNVRRLNVVELLAPVIAWHRARLVPMAEKLMSDPRCMLIEGDFFEHVSAAQPDASHRYDVILVDIDHSPDCWLHPGNRDFYTGARMASLAAHLNPGGAFGLWSADKPSSQFMDLLFGLYASVRSHEVCFFNRHVSESDSNWVLVAEQPRQ